MLIPKSVPAGEYVLNWRYDCEVRKTNDARFLVGVILNYKLNDHFTKTGSGQTNTGKALEKDMRFPQESNQVWQKTHIFCTFKTTILLRQARDKHRENTQKMRVPNQVWQSCADVTVKA